MSQIMGDNARREERLEQGDWHLSPTTLALLREQEPPREGRLEDSEPAHLLFSDPTSYTTPAVLGTRTGGSNIKETFRMARKSNRNEELLDLDDAMGRSAPPRSGVQSGKARAQFAEDDPRNEATIEGQYRPILARLDIATQGFQEIPYQRTERTGTGITRQTRQLQRGDRCRVPDEVRSRLEEAERERIPWASFLWIEEQQLDSANVLSWQWWASPPEPTTKDITLVGIIHPTSTRGLWCEIGRWSSGKGTSLTPCTL